MKVMISRMKHFVSKLLLHYLYIISISIITIVLLIVKFLLFLITPRLLFNGVVESTVLKIKTPNKIFHGCSFVEVRLARVVTDKLGAQ